MLTAETTQAGSPTVLTEALLNAGQRLGLSQAELGQVVGKERISISRGISETSKAGELALLFIRCYRNLYVLAGGNTRDMKHWMQTNNLHTGGIPAEQVKTAVGLTRIVEYLDALHGKD